jgi:riboflavin synthase
MKEYIIGIADTMFARGDMGGLAEKTIRDSKKPVKIIRYTVPGFKDLPAACCMLFEKGCNIVVALGMAGGAPIDKTCAHEASLGIQMAQVKYVKHIIEVFVFQDEAVGDDRKLSSIMADRTQKHALNALDLLFDPKSLTRRAGTGQRQGGPNSKAVQLE